MLLIDEANTGEDVYSGNRPASGHRDYIGPHCGGTRHHSGTHNSEIFKLLQQCLLSQDAVSPDHVWLHRSSWLLYLRQTEDAWLMCSHFFEIKIVCRLSAAALF